MTRRYTVPQLTTELTELLASRYPLIEVEAELSQVSVPASGHAYLTLADGDSILGAVVWRSTWQQIVRPPKRGDRVVCRGKLGVYAGKGAYQLYVSSIVPAGEGQLAAEIARRRARLEAEGLLDPRRKRALPAMPRFVGVATSLTGAALQDFLKVSGERFPAARILVAGCLVQGASAPQSVVAAVDLLLDDGRSDVIIVTRGGGSKEDLLAFQDEGLARFLAHCPVPVVSAVGHQIDTTLADLVADAVAPTPTGAAVIALPDGPGLAQRVDDRAAALLLAMRAQVERRRARSEALSARLRHPGQRLGDVRRRERELSARLAAAWRRRLERARSGSEAARARIDAAGARMIAPRRARVVSAEARLLAATRGRLPTARARVVSAEVRLRAAITRLLERRRARVDGLLGRADALSPRAVLARGFAVVVGPSGVVTDPASVSAGDRLALRVAKGTVAAVVADEG